MPTLYEVMSQVAIASIKRNNKDFFYIFALSKEAKKLFFMENGGWTEDINKVAITSDFNFIFNIFKEIFDNPRKRNNLIDNLMPF